MEVGCGVGILKKDGFSSPQFFLACSMLSGTMVIPQFGDSVFGRSGMQTVPETTTFIQQLVHKITEQG